VRLWVLGSGSRGNAVLLESGETRLLVDAGFGVRELALRLTAVGVAPESIQACVVTHEHADHVKGAAAASARWGWELYATAGTATNCPALGEADARTVDAGASFAIGEFDLRTVPTPHDAAEPVAVVVTARRTGAQAAVCYDLGHATDAVRQAVRGVDVLVVESNHDEAMLRTGPYPPSVCARIAGRDGHLSNRAAGALTRQVAHRGLGHVVLAHLSEQCNDARLAVAEMTQALARTTFRGAVHAACQQRPVGPFAPGAGRHRAPAAVQLGLGL
jgi:phosphoribosyl 1,2-cyclic phosphodiesterase